MDRRFPKAHGQSGARDGRTKLPHLAWLHDDKARDNGGILQHGRGGFHVELDSSGRNKPRSL
jgi:hypothetical protein